MEPLATNSSTVVKTLVYNFQSKSICVQYSDGRLTNSTPFKEMTESDRAIYIAPQLDLIQKNIAKLKKENLIHQSAVFDKMAFANELILDEVVEEEVE